MVSRIGRNADIEGSRTFPPHPPCPTSPKAKLIRWVLLPLSPPLLPPLPLSRRANVGEKLFYAGLVIPFIPWLVAIVIVSFIPTTDTQTRQEEREEKTFRVWKYRQVGYWGVLCVVGTCAYCVVGLVAVWVYLEVEVGGVDLD